MQKVLVLRNLWKPCCVLLCLALLAGCAPRSGGAPSNEASIQAEPSPLETVRALAAINRDTSFAPLVNLDAYPPDMQRILRRGEIIFAMTAADQKPFFYIDKASGQLIGLDVEIGYAIANTLGVKAVFNRDSASFDDVVRNVAAKKADVALSKLSRTLRRATLVRYTNPYISYRQALLVNRLELAKITSEEKLPAYIKNFTGKLGVIQNSSYVGYAATNFPDAQIVTFPSWDACVQALFAGQVLAVYRDEGEILIINETRESASILMKPVFINDKLDTIAMAVAEDAPMLQEWLNLFLADYVVQHKDDLVPMHLIKRHYKEKNEG
jgi:ABC-type amino acid transport substrate-binding protein